VPSLLELLHVWASGKTSGMTENARPENDGLEDDWTNLQEIYRVWKMMDHVH